MDGNLEITKEMENQQNRNRIPLQKKDIGSTLV